MIVLPAYSGFWRPTVSGGGGGPTFPTTNLISHWRLNEASGTRNDAHSTNHLTDNNTVTSATGKLGNAGQFVAANSEYLSIADNAALSAGDVDLVIAAWVYLDSKTAIRPIVSKWHDSTTASREYSLRYVQSSDRFGFTVRGGATQTIILADSLGIPAISTWYFLMAWHDATANTINIQVNDGTVDSAAHTTGMNDAAAPFMIGYWQSGVAGAYMDGRIDSVSVWKGGLLTSGQRTDVYNAGNALDY